MCATLLISLLRFSGHRDIKLNTFMTSTPDSESPDVLKDPDSRYHIASLQPPAQVRALDSVPQPDDRFSTDSEVNMDATRYVQGLIDELHISKNVEK